MEELKEEMISWLKDPSNHKIKQPSSSLNQKKSLEEAQKCRQDGNRLYTACCTNDDFQTTYLHYAKSIAHAPADSREMALAYSNLSAVLLRIGHYSECRQAIDSCLNLDYPEESKFKIYLRKIECLKILGEPLEAKRIYVETSIWIAKNGSESTKEEMKTRLEQCYKCKVEVKKRFTEEEIDKVWDNFSIKSCNKEVPGASSAIELRHNESQGRHFVASRDIRAGEVLAKERPFFNVCSMEMRYLCCWECLKFLPNCIPCDHCENVIFCSVECKDKAWKKYHHLECELLLDLSSIADSSRLAFFIIAAFRVFLIAMKEYGTVDCLRQVVENWDNLKDPRTKGFINGQLLSDKFAAFYSLTSFNDVPFTVPFAGQVIYEIVTKTSLLGEKLKLGWKELAGNEDVVFAATLIARNLNICVNNASETSHFLDNYSSRLTGFCLSICGSLMNHSCVGNIFLFTSTPYTKLFAVLPIKKGEQVFLDYMDSSLYGRDKRQHHFQSKYHFTCKCIACTDNWPLMNDYPNLYSIPVRFRPILESILRVAAPYYTEAQEIVEGIGHKHSCRDYKYMTTILQKLSEAIQKINDKVPQPSMDLRSMQDIMSTFFVIFHTTHLGV